MLWGKFDGYYGKVGCLYCKWIGHTYELEKQKMGAIDKRFGDWEKDSCPNCGSTNVGKILQANKNLKIDRVMGHCMSPVMLGGTDFVRSITHTLNYILDSHFCKDIKITIDDSVYKFNIREVLYKLHEMGLAEKGDLEDELREENMYNMR